MTRFETFATDVLENGARRLLGHVEAAAERENLPPPEEALKMALILRQIDIERRDNSPTPRSE
jgi:hypothetical protein